MAATNQPAAPPKVTCHARLRYRQRVDPGGGDLVDDAIRDMFRRGEPVHRPDIIAGAARRCGEYLVVHTRGECPVIKTIVRAGGDHGE